MLNAAVGISEISHGHDGTGNFLEQLGGGFGAGGVSAIGDVAGANEN